VLAKTHRFLLEIHAAGDVETQRRVIPRGLAELIPCDRAALNEFIFRLNRVIVPSPMPVYWDRLGPVMLEHLHEHALFSRCPPAAHEAITFGDRRHDAEWRKSTLYHEYYLPAGVRHQLSVHVFRQGPVRFMLNCNRWHRDFSAADRALMELISPHVEYAVRDASRLTWLRASDGAIGDRGPMRTHTVIVDQDGRIRGELASCTRDVLRKFGMEVIPGNLLPELLRGWVSMQRLRLRTADALGRTPEILRARRETAVLSVQLGQAAPDTTVILLTENSMAPASEKPLPGSLTSRETEVARWICEGKRNAEIGAILGISSRTVGKHMDHIFEKIGVHTRTAAQRALRERGWCGPQGQ
jgi:DNA-binding CsgD family transcriptional regulator